MSLYFQLTWNQNLFQKKEKDRIGNKLVVSIFELWEWVCVCVGMQAGSLWLNRETPWIPWSESGCKFSVEMGAD